MSLGSIIVWIVCEPQRCKDILGSGGGLYAWEEGKEGGFELGAEADLQSTFALRTSEATCAVDEVPVESLEDP